MACRRAEGRPSIGWRHKRLPQPGLAAPQGPVCEPLKRLLPLVISECSRGDNARLQRERFDALLHQHHYLSHRSSVGENLQYLVSDAQDRPLACVLFGAAAWQCASRDRYIGWDSSARAQHLHQRFRQYLQGPTASTNAYDNGKLISQHSQ